MKTSFWAWAFAAPLIGQIGPPVQTVQGIVVDANSGAPLAGAYVSVYGASPLITRTEGGGFFRLEGTSGNVHVMRAGYLEASNVTATPGIDLTVRLVPEAVISGSVLDDDGFPVSSGQVQAMRYQVMNGEKTLRSVRYGNVNDLGEYRISGLAAGRYYLRVVSTSAMKWDSRYVAQFLGGGVQPDQEHTVELRTGEHREKTDIHLAKHEGVTVSGRIEMPEGTSPQQHPFVRLQSRNDFPGSFFSPRRQQPDGTFIISRVIPGSYWLIAQSGGGMLKAGDLIAKAPIEVSDADVRDVVLTAHAAQAVDVSGAVLAEGGGEPGPMLIGLRPRMGGRSISAHSGTDGSFVLKGLLPGHYDLQAIPDSIADVASGQNPRRLSVTSARLGDKEVLLRGFDIDGPPPGPLTITLGKLADITGKITDVSGQPHAGATLIFTTPDAVRWGSAVSGPDGAFRAAVVPGEYRVYVVPDQSAASDPDFLEAHADDFPVVHAVAGENPPIALTEKPL